MFSLAFLLSSSPGQGEADNEWTSSQTGASPTIADSPSFAPCGLPITYSKFRRKLPNALKLDVPRSKGAVTRIHNLCSVRVHPLQSVWNLEKLTVVKWLERFKFSTWSYGECPISRAIQIYHYRISASQRPFQYNRIQLFQYYSRGAC